MISDSLKWKIISGASGLLAVAAVQAIISKSWKAVKHEDPPENPASIDTSWNEALSWTIATAVAAGLARLIAQRYAVTGWKKVTGHMPPV